MDSNDLTTLLTLIFVIIYAFKIGYHFNYFKAIDQSIKEITFITFYINLFNIKRSIQIILPLFFSKVEDKKTEVQQGLARKALAATLILWGWMVISLYLSTNQNESNRINMILERSSPKQFTITARDKNVCATALICTNSKFSIFS